MKVVSFLKPYRKPMIIAWLLMLIELTVELLSPILMAKIIDEGIIPKDSRVLLTWGIVLLILSLISFASGITNSFFAAGAGQHFGYDIRKELFRKIQNLSYSTINEFSTSSFITRLTNDVTQLQNIVFMSLRIAFRAPLLVLFGTVMAFIVNWRLALIFVLSIPVIVVILIFVMKKATQLFQTLQKRLDHVNRIMRENLQGIRLIKAFYQFTFERERFKKVNKNLQDSSLKAFRFIEFTGPSILFLMNICIVLVLWFGQKELLAGHTNAGDLVAIVNYGTRITMALGMLTWIIMAFSRAKASNDRINEVLSMEDEKDAPISTKVFINEGKIEFENTSFRYPNQTFDAIRNINFSVAPKQTVAIIGATGSGKTTIFQLIPRLFNATKGKVKIDGVDVLDIPSKELRMKIGYVPQESHLFTGTIRENILWGNREASMEEIVEAAKDAQIYDTILSFPNGFDTVIGQKGVNLSGGQKQRLSIARALVRKPKILLLDDSTSALDLETERKLLKSIEKYECTLLIITQKITTAKKADYIILLDEGKLVASGTHEELQKESELYQKILCSQDAKEVLTNA